MGNKTKMAKYNVTGERKEYENVYYKLEDDVYEGKITAVRGPVSTPPLVAGEQPKVKTIFDCSVPRDGEDDAVLQLWIPLTVSKGGKAKDGTTYSNSKLYDILSKAQLLAELDAYVTKNLPGVTDNIPDDKLVEFLRAFLVGRECKFDVVSKINKAGQQYSVAKDVKRFTDTHELEVEQVSLDEAKPIEHPAQTLAKGIRRK